MSGVSAIRCLSAPFDHRLAVGDGQTMAEDPKTGLRSPPRPLCAHPLACPSAAIPAAHCADNLIRIASVTAATNRRNSNPHSGTYTLPPCQTARGFLPRGLSAAYRRLR